jgi:soluble lytic murein transglycosylase-like protein
VSTVRAMIALTILAWATGSSAHADVLEIGDDGVVITYAGATVYTDAGGQPITMIDGASPADAIPALVVAAAERYGIDAHLLTALARQESGFSSTARSPKGAVGVMQLMPATARELGVDRFDTGQNVLGGAAYLGRMLRRYHGDAALALAAYNAGPGAVDRYGAVPPYPETRAYVRGILARRAAAAATATDR